MWEITPTWWSKKPFVRMNTSVEWDITTPDFDHHAVSVTTAGYVSGLEFGVNNLPIVQGVDVVGGVVVGGGIGTLEFGDLLKIKSQTFNLPCTSRK